MSLANPTPLRVGAKGALHGWHVTVTARLVLSVELAGVTYFWNEYMLLGDSGNSGTLVYEETEHGPEWKLFREFQPLRVLSAAEAATKRVGDTINLDGHPTRITLVDESRVVHIEGQAPEGVQVGDVAHYFNADTGRRMLVASWTGGEIEFYEGEDVPATLVAQAFGFPAPAARQGLRGGMPRSGAAPSHRVVLVIVVLFAIAIGAAVVLAGMKRSRSSPASSRTPASMPAVRLPVGAQGTLDAQAFTITAVQEVEIGRVTGRLKRREYRLVADTGGRALLVSGLTGAAKEWHLLRPTEMGPLDPFAAASQRKGARLELGGGSAQVSELFLTRTLAAEGAAEGLPVTGSVRYGFLAQQQGGQPVVARWDEAGIEFHIASRVAETEVLAAFVAPEKAQR
jgi:hypothetical protein